MVDGSGFSVVKQGRSFLSETGALKMSMEVFHFLERLREREVCKELGRGGARMAKAGEQRQGKCAM